MPVNMIDRTGANALIPVPLANQIFASVAENSAVLSLARRLPNMTAQQLRLPVMNMLPAAYFLAGDTDAKPTTKVTWENKVIVAEEVAVIVPVSENVLSDSAFDIWAAIQPFVSQAFGAVIDKAILYGTNKPTSWPTAIVPGATAAGNAIAMGTGANLYQDILGEDGVISLVEQDGYMVSGYIGAMSLRGMLRGVVGTDEHPLFAPGAGMRPPFDPYNLDGQPTIFPRNGAIDPTVSLLIGGDWTQAVYSIRQDLTYRMLTEATIKSSDGGEINLAQQDMVGLRFAMRLGWQLPNPINAINPNGTQRYPFAVLTPSAE